MRAVAGDSIANGIQAAFFAREGFGDADDPEAGEGFVIAGGVGVLAAGGDVELADGEAEAVEGGEGVLVDPSSGDEDVAAVGELRFG